MINGCLPDDSILLYEVEFPSDDDIVTFTSSDLSVEYTFGSVDQVSDMELNVTITPVLPTLRLLGTPKATTLPHEG